MKTTIRKAVFPVAGLGTRFLPATKANPKEMLPIVDKPLIQYAVEEAVASGITEMIFVTSSSKRAIEDHFDTNFELETKLAEKGKDDLLALVKDILPSGVSCVYVRQHEQLGLGHAVLCAKDLVCGEPFAVLLADDLIAHSGKSCLQQMVDIYDNTGDSVLAVQKVAKEDTDKYGIVALDKQECVTAMVEKPDPKDAPSNIAVVGRYVLSHRIFHYLEQTKSGAIGEIQLTDGIAALLAEEKVRICEFDGTRYDCGSKLGYLQATVEYALQHPEVGTDFQKYLRTRF